VGLMTRTDGSTGKTPKDCIINDWVFREYLTFFEWVYYAVKFGVPLPGRIPNHKCKGDFISLR
jgi:hypothetical protein